MKKVSLIIIYLFVCITVLAERNVPTVFPLQEVMMQLQLTDNQNHILTGQHKSPALMPQVAYDNQYLYITTHYDITDAQIIIRDENNNIIYDIYTTLISSGSVIALPEYVMENKYCIELTFLSKTYIGFFIAY